MTKNRSVSLEEEPRGFSEKSKDASTGTIAEEWNRKEQEVHIPL
jgi:hypothetical protein